MKYSEEETQMKIEMLKKEIKREKDTNKLSGSLKSIVVPIDCLESILKLIEKQQDETKSARKDSDKWFKKIARSSKERK